MRLLAAQPGPLVGASGAPESVRGRSPTARPVCRQYSPVAGRCPPKPGGLGYGDARSARRGGGPARLAALHPGSHDRWVITRGSELLLSDLLVMIGALLEEGGHRANGVRGQ